MTAYALFHGWVQDEIDGIQINGKNYSTSKILALEANNEALTARVKLLAETLDATCKENEDLETQLAAARKALKTIADAPAWGFPEKWETTPAEVRHLAREALETKPS